MSIVVRVRDIFQIISRQMGTGVEQNPTCPCRSGHSGAVEEGDTFVGVVFVRSWVGVRFRQAEWR